MNSTLTIKDLALDKALDSKAMCAVRGGIFDQANATQKANVQNMSAGVEVANLANFAGSGPVNFQVTSNPSQYASNDTYSTNHVGYPYYYYW